MIEPPCDFWRTGILEIDDGIFVPVEVVLVEQRACTMKQAASRQIRRCCEYVPDKNVKKGLRRKPHRNICRDRRPELARNRPSRIAPTPLLPFETGRKPKGDRVATQEGFCQASLGERNAFP